MQAQHSSAFELNANTGMLTHAKSHDNAEQVWLLDLTVGF